MQSTFPSFYKDHFGGISEIWFKTFDSMAWHKVDISPNSGQTTLTPLENNVWKLSIQLIIHNSSKGSKWLEKNTKKPLIAMFKDKKGAKWVIRENAHPLKFSIQSCAREKKHSYVTLCTLIDF